MALSPSTPPKTLFLLRWWDFEQKKAMTLTLPFNNGREAFKFLSTMPGLDYTKKCGAFALD